jgi:poly(ADP-ribose) glycohydrolase ARH3
MNVSLQDRFRGCLVGLAVGDALGGRFEAQSADYIRGRLPTVEHLINYVTDELWYTDDTQMAIGVAESLADQGEIVEAHLCQSFVANYMPSRGYGRGARAVLDAMEDGGDYQAVAARHFPGGSYGNGAAMRVAPVGLFFRDDPRMVLDQSRLSALPTHVHPLGIEGAQLIALAVAHASTIEQFDRDAFFAALLEHCHSSEYRNKLESAAKIQTTAELLSLGNGIEALESAPTAIASFALTPDSYQETIGNVIFLGGDTDTLAAMAGAISGAFLGIAAIPSVLIDNLETSPKGGSYIIELSDRLLASCQDRIAAATKDK